MPFGFHLAMDTLPSGESLLRPTTHYRRLWIWRPSFERQRDFNPPEQRAAQRTVRTSPPPHTARPGSRELPVDPYRDHRWSFPCCLWSPMSACRRHYPGRTEGTDSLVVAPSTSAFPRLQLGQLLHYQFRGLLSVHSRYDLQTCQVALCDPLYRRLRRLCYLRRRSDCFYEKVIKVKADVAALLICSPTSG